jgi:sulfur carrier protein
MQIWLNGSAYQVAQGITTVQQLLQYLNLHQRVLMIEHNGNIWQPEDNPATSIAEGDTLEIVHFVGGG